MRVHFAEASDGRGQYQALLDEGVVDSLASYHYLKSPHIRKPFEWMWGELLNLHLTTTARAPVVADGMGSHDKHLMSYAHKKSEQQFGRAWTNGMRARVLIDSGAFTAFSSGKPIVAEEYGEWALRFAVRWSDKMESLRFINLDVIGDQIGTWRNQETLERMGLNPIPVVTQGADMLHLTHALERYEYVCLGGLVPLAPSRIKMRAWLDRCFREVLRFRAETGKLRKIHLLGVTQPWVLMRYPVYSCDSSSWVQPFRFGGAKSAGIKARLPKYKSGDAAFAATLHAIRHEVKRYKKMELDATALWRSRGVDFGEGGA